jgi:hypothetical protein
MSERRRIKHTATFEQRLANEAERIKTEEGAAAGQRAGRHDAQGPAGRDCISDQRMAVLAGTAEANLIAQSRSPVSKGMPEITARDLI